MAEGKWLSLSPAQDLRSRPESCATADLPERPFFFRRFFFFFRAAACCSRGIRLGRLRFFEAAWNSLLQFIDDGLQLTNPLLQLTGLLPLRTNQPPHYVKRLRVALQNVVYHPSSSVINET